MGKLLFGFWSRRQKQLIAERKDKELLESARDALYVQDDDIAQLIADENLAPDECSLSPRGRKALEDLNKGAENLAPSDCEPD